MDNDQLQRLKNLATDSLIKYVNDEDIFQLAQALETAVEAIGDFDSMVDQVNGYEEDNAELKEQVKDLSDSLREVYRISKSPNSSDVKRLAEIQETCEAADVDLHKYVTV